MTPSPTPTPSTDACYYRDAQFNGSTVHVLVDAFGRMLVMDDNGTYFGIAWNDNGLTSDFESDGDHAAEFNAIRTAWGYNECITDFTDEAITFTDEGGESVQLTFDNVEKTYVPIVSEIENGTPNMFYRTLNDGTDDITFVCDADGKICVFNDSYFLIKTNENQFVPSNNASMLNVLSSAAGGSTVITQELSTEGEFNKYTNGEYSIVTNANGDITFGELSGLPSPVLYYKDCYTDTPNGRVNGVIVCNGSGNILYIERNYVKDAIAKLGNDIWSFVDQSHVTVTGSWIKVEAQEEDGVYTFNVDGVECSFDYNNHVVTPTPEEYE